MPPAAGAGFDPARQLSIIQRAVAKRSFCVLATSSAQNRPHAVGILYASVGLTLYLVVAEDSIKARNVRQNPRVAVSIPVRKYLFGPPMAVQFQGTARILPPDDPTIRGLAGAGRLKKITGPTGLERPGIRFLEVTPGRRVSSYGLGISLRQLLRDVSQGARSVELPAATRAPDGDER